MSSRSIAIVGASTLPAAASAQSRCVDLLRRAAFQRLYPVNPKNRTAQGLRCWPDIESIGEPVGPGDHALSADATLPYLKRCHAIGVRQPSSMPPVCRDQLRPKAGRAKTSSPPSQGSQACDRRGRIAWVMQIFTDGISRHSRVVPTRRACGSIALLTQAAICAPRVPHGTARRCASAMSSIPGNERPVEFSDYLQFSRRRPATTAVLCYIEELRNGPAFLRAAAALRQERQTSGGIQGRHQREGRGSDSRSHTAALAAIASAYDAAFVKRASPEPPS